MGISKEELEVWQRSHPGETPPEFMTYDPWTHGDNGSHEDQWSVPVPDDIKHDATVGDGGMQFTLTVRFPNGQGGGIESHTLTTMRDELTAVSRLLDAMAPGETITIKRVR